MTEYNLIVGKDGALNLLVVSNHNAFPNYIEDEYSLMLIMRECFALDRLDSEMIFAVSINDREEVNGVYQISKGDYNKCLIYNRTVASFLLLTRAVRFLLVHNHPNQILKSSGEDLASSILMKSMGDLLGISFSGIYSITKDGYVKTGCPDEVINWDD